jgi:hypothetical protein
MNIPIINKAFIARHRLRFGLGSGIIGTFFFVFSLLTFAKVWEKTFEFYNIPTVIIYIGMPISYLIVCWSIGYLYDTRGFWEMENSHSNTQLNPEFVTLCDNAKDLILKMNGFSAKIDSLLSRIEELENELKDVK